MSFRGLALIPLFLLCGAIWYLIVNHPDIAFAAIVCDGIIGIITFIAAKCLIKKRSSHGTKQTQPGSLN